MGEKKQVLTRSDVGCGVHGRVCRIEAEWGKSETRILVSGADRILRATDCEVVLIAHGGELHICGIGVTCLTYEGGIAEIRGNIKEIHLSEG